MTPAVAAMETVFFSGGGGEPAHQKPFTGEASAKYSFKRQLRRKLGPGQLQFDT